MTKAKGLVCRTMQDMEGFLTPLLTNSLLLVSADNRLLTCSSRSSALSSIQQFSGDGCAFLPQMLLPPAKSRTSQLSIQHHGDNGRNKSCRRAFPNWLQKCWTSTLTWPEHSKWREQNKRDGSSVRNESLSDSLPVVGSPPLRLQSLAPRKAVRNALLSFEDFTPPADRKLRVATWNRCRRLLPAVLRKRLFLPQTVCNFWCEPVI